MFGKSYRLFKLLGFEVSIDLSWLVIAVLITWSLASGLFPYYYENLSTATYWWMGVLGAVGLFLSIILHELSHSIVARRHGIPMRGITLFIFGGVAQMSEEPPSAKSEFRMAIAGPIASIIIGVTLYGIDIATQGIIASVPFHGIIRYLAFINLILAAFNMVPAFPLDGGRVLRSALWGWKKNLNWATRIASKIGTGFGFLLIALGVLSFINGSFIGGAWWFLIGLFLHKASQMSYQQLLMRRMLEGESVERFMKKDPVTISLSMRVNDVIENYFYRYHFKMFPVVEDSKLLGCVTINQIKHVAPEERKNLTVKEILSECTDENTISADSDAVKALSKMNRTQNSRLMVRDNGHLEGIIALKDMMKFLSTKIELEEDFR